MLYANGVARTKPLLIFKGKGDRFGRLVDRGLRAEFKLYDERVKVIFNDKAYSNTDIMIE